MDKGIGWLDWSLINSPVNTIKAMSSTISLPNHNFPGQAYSSKQLKNTYAQSCCTRNRQLPFLNQQKGENDHKNISWSISIKECCWTKQGSDPWQDVHSTEPRKLASWTRGDYCISYGSLESVFNCRLHMSKDCKMLTDEMKENQVNSLLLTCRYNCDPGNLIRSIYKFLLFFFVKECVAYLDTHNNLQKPGPVLNSQTVEGMHFLSTKLGLPVFKVNQ